MKKLFSIEVRIAATAYILADSAEEAKAKADKLNGTGLEFSSRRWEVSDDITVTGETYNPDMPEISLSPAMTLVANDYRTVDLVEEFAEEEPAAWTGRGGFIDFSVGEDGYDVHVYDGNAHEIASYTAGNHAHDSQAYVPRGHPERVPKQTLRKFARQTAEEMAAEHGVSLVNINETPSEED